jgi:hypothetical protein
MNAKEMEAKLNELELANKMLTERVTVLEDRADGRQRGPKTERPMTDADAFRVKFGDLKPPVTHKDAAAQLGLSYGQVFSARGGYTFKHVKDGSRNQDGSEKSKPEGGAK